MQLVLEIIEGPGIGRRVVLNPGQKATIGRTEYADYAFFDVSEMSSLHFRLECGEQECIVHDLNSLNGTTLNGKRITDEVLRDGDQLAVGKTIFRVLLASDTPAEMSVAAGAPVPTAQSGIGTTVPASATAPETPAREAPSPLLDESGFVDCGVPQTCQRIQELGDEAKALVRDDLTPQQFAKTLVEKDLLEDAVRFLAYALCKRHAVDWGCGCVREGMGQLSDDDAAALDIAQTWVQEPSENHRRDAQAAAEKLEHATAASWVAMGAFFSEGSVAPPDAPTIPPEPHLTAHCVTGAVMLAGVAEEPEKAPDKFRQFIATGCEID